MFFLALFKDVGLVLLQRGGRPSVEAGSGGGLQSDRQGVNHQSVRREVEHGGPGAPVVQPLQTNQIQHHRNKYLDPKFSVVHEYLTLIILEDGKKHHFRYF